MENGPQFNPVDIVALVYVLFVLIRGFFRGLSGELARLLSAAAAVAAGLYFYRPVGEWLADNTRLAEWGESLPFGLAFGLMLLGAWLLMRLLRLVLKSLMVFSFRGNLERVGGGLAGGIRASVVAAALILLLGLWPSETMRRVFVDESVLGRNLARHVLPVYDRLAEKYPAIRLPAPSEVLEEQDPGPEWPPDREVPAGEEPDAEP